VLSLLSVPVDGERVICQDRLVTTREELRQRTAAFYAQLICGTGGSREQQRVKVGGILVFLPGMMEIRKLCDLLAESRTFSDSKRFVVLGLHSSLDSQAQRAIFRKHPPGVVKIVVRDLLLLLLIVGTFRSAFYFWNFSPSAFYFWNFSLSAGVDKHRRDFDYNRRDYARGGHRAGQGDAVQSREADGASL
jgi:hypothetical protein